MALLAPQHVPTPQYVAAIERLEEMGRLQDQARRRKSMLVFGPEGVGKTRLVESFVKTQSLALYVNQTGSPRDLMLALWRASAAQASGSYVYLPPQNH